MRSLRGLIRPAMLHTSVAAAWQEKHVGIIPGALSSSSQKLEVKRVDGEYLTIRNAAWWRLIDLAQKPNLPFAVTGLYLFAFQNVPICQCIELDFFFQIGRT